MIRGEEQIERGDVARLHQPRQRLRRQDELSAQRAELYRIRALALEAARIVEAGWIRGGWFGYRVGDPTEDLSFDERDSARVPHVAIINEMFARRHFPGEDPIGRTLITGMAQLPSEIVGVVADVHHHGLDRAAEPEIYVPYAQASVESMTVLLRSGGDLASLAGAAREAVWRIDDQLPLDDTGPVIELVRGSVSGHRMRALVLNAFAWVALGLAALGISDVTRVGGCTRCTDEQWYSHRREPGVGRQAGVIVRGRRHA